MVGFSNPLGKASKILERMCNPPHSVECQAMGTHMLLAKSYLYHIQPSYIKQIYISLLKEVVQ